MGDYTKNIIFVDNISFPLLLTFLNPVFQVHYQFITPLFLSWAFLQNLEEEDITETCHERKSIFFESNTIDQNNVADLDCS